MHFTAGGLSHHGGVALRRYNWMSVLDPVIWSNSYGSYGTDDWLKLDRHVKVSLWLTDAVSGRILA